MLYFNICFESDKEQSEWKRKENQYRSRLESLLYQPFFFFFEICFKLNASIKTGERIPLTSLWGTKTSTAWQTFGDLNGRPDKAGVT